MNQLDSATQPDATTLPELRFYYSAFGLTFGSDTPFEEMTAIAPCDPDITVRRAKIPGVAITNDRAANFDFDNADFRLTWRDFATFRINGTDEVTFDPEEGIDESMLSFAFHGPVMAMLLHLRGRLVLHASCVSVNGQGVAFLGHKMAGKSTTAGAFLRAGHTLVSDDLVGLDLLSQGGASVAPAFGQIKLTPEASEALRLEAEVLSAGERAMMMKQQHRLADKLVTSDVPMAAICILERGSEAKLTRLSEGEALPELLVHSYVQRFGSAALPTQVKAAHMKHCIKAMAQIPVYRMTVPTGLDRLHEAVTMMENATADRADMHGYG